MTVLFLSIFAGTIGATLAAGHWPARSMSGVMNTALGLIGGTLAWAATVEIAALEQSLSTFMIVFGVGMMTGALATLGAGSLRNLLAARG